ARRRRPETPGRNGPVPRGHASRMGARRMDFRRRRAQRPATLCSMNARFEELKRRLGEIHDVEKAAAVLSWDEETKMPPLGAEARAEQSATLNRIAAETCTAPARGQ